MPDSHISIPARQFYEGVGGWADGRLGQAYDLVSQVLKERGSQVHHHPLMAAIEQADINIKEGLEP